MDILKKTMTWILLLQWLAWSPLNMLFFSCDKCMHCIQAKSIYTKPASAEAGHCNASKSVQREAISAQVQQIAAKANCCQSSSVLTQAQDDSNQSFFKYTICKIKCQQQPLVITHPPLLARHLSDIFKLAVLAVFLDSSFSSQSAETPSFHLSVSTKVLSPPLFLLHNSFLI